MSPRVGVDLVDVAAFRARVEGRESVLKEIFSEAELHYAGRQHQPWVHLAARFAAKEATLKALGSGLAGQMTWRDVEVTRDVAGTPGLAIQGATAALLERQALKDVAVSLSHTDTHAIAVVVLS